MMARKVDGFESMPAWTLLSSTLFLLYSGMMKLMMREGLGREGKRKRKNFWKRKELDRICVMMLCGDI